MELIKLFNLQGSLFIMILAGAVLNRKRIIDEPGKRCLTDFGGRNRHAALVRLSQPLFVQ